MCTGCSNNNHVEYTNITFSDCLLVRKIVDICGACVIPHRWLIPHMWVIPHRWLIPHMWVIPHRWLIPHLWVIPHRWLIPHLWVIPHRWLIPHLWVIPHRWLIPHVGYTPLLHLLNHLPPDSLKKSYSKKQDYTIHVHVLMFTILKLLKDK